jgi:hypothetical protein
VVGLRVTTLADDSDQQVIDGHVPEASQAERAGKQVFLQAASFEFGHQPSPKAAQLLVARTA